MSKKYKIGRRKSLKLLASVGVGSVTLVNGVAAKGSSINTNFDPSNQSEVEEFLSNYNKDLNNLLGEEKKEFKRRIEAELSSSQKEAIADYFATQATIEINPTPMVASSEVSLNAVSGTFDTDYTVNAAINTRIGTFDAFDYTHEIEWDVSGSDVVDCISRRPSYNTYSHLGALYWSFDHDDVEALDINDTHCEATRRATFTRNFISGDIASTTDTCSITLLGDDKGYGSAPSVLLNGDDY